MTTDIIAHNKDQLLAIKHSIYPDASLESIAMVLEYCKAAGVDVMSKAVHIVPMAGKDVIIPGIGLYRIKASRSGEYLGTDSPVYGPEVTENLGNMTTHYPAWCEVSVKRLVQGHIATFTAREFWKKNYGSGRDGTPNMIWAKRPHGQISKTAESQALRKAFPELVSHQMVYEETHNAISSMQEHEVTDAQIAVKNASNKLKADLKIVQVQPPAEHAALYQKVHEIIMLHNITQEEINKWLHKASVEHIKQLSVPQLQGVIKNIKETRMAKMKLDFEQPQDLKPINSLLAEGDATFVVKKVYTTKKDGAPLVSSKGDPMVSIMLSVKDCNGEEGTLYDYFTPAMTWKVYSLCEAIGHPELYQPEFDFDDVINCIGKLKISIDSRPGYARRNNVKSYIKAKPKPTEQPMAEIVDNLEDMDSVPF